MDPNYMSRLIEWEKEIEEDGLAFLSTVENMEQRLKMMSIQLEKLKILQEQYVFASQEQLRRKSSLPINQASNQYVPESMFFTNRTSSTDAHKSAGYDASHMHGDSTFRAPRVDTSTNISLFNSVSKTEALQNIGFTSSTPYNPTNMVQTKPLALTSELFMRELLSHDSSFFDDMQNKLTQNRNELESSLNVFALPSAEKTQQKDSYDEGKTIKDKVAGNKELLEKHAVEEGVYNTVDISTVTIENSAAETECRQEEQQQNNAASVVVSKTTDPDDGSYYSPPRRKIEMKNVTPVKKLVISDKNTEEPDVSLPCGETTDNTTRKSECDVPISDVHKGNKVADDVEGDKRGSLISNKQETVAVSVHNSPKPTQERIKGEIVTNTSVSTPDKNTKKATQSRASKVSDPIKEQSKIVEKVKKASENSKVSRNISSKSLGSSTATDSDDSFFDGNIPLTSSAAYKSMIGAGDSSIKPSKVIEESESDSDSEDDVERALAMAVNKNKPKPSNEPSLIKSPVKNSQTSSSPSSASKSKPDDVSGKKNKTSAAQVKPRSMRPSISASSSKIKFSKATRQALGLDSESDDSPQLTKKFQKEESDDEFDFYD